MKLRMKILVVQIVLILIVGAGLGIVSIYNSTKVLTAQLEEQLVEKVADNKQYIEERFERSFTELEAIAQNDIIKGMKLDDQLDFLADEIEKLDYLTLAVVTPDGTAHYIDGSTAELGDRDYIKQALDGEAAMSDVIVSRATEELVMMLATPIESKGEVVGALIARVDGFYLSEIVDTLAFGETGYGFILNEEGTFLGHEDRELVANQVNYVEAGDENADFIKYILEEESGSFEYVYDGIDRQVAFDRLENGWILTIGAHQTEFASEINRLRGLLLLIITVGSIIGLVIAYFFAGSISRPLQAITEHGKKVAEGDFSVDAEEQYLSRKDEVGELAHTFQTMTYNMRTMLAQVNDSAEQVEKAVAEMTERTELTAMMADETRDLVEEVKESSEIQLESAKDSSVAMQEMAQGTERVATIATEVSGASNEIHQQTEEGGKLLERSLAQMEDIQQGSLTTSETIHTLQRTSEEINEITEIITDIADQTNLLALNASIEAARAGEAGSGFAVVADEIRKLSEQTASSALDINQLIESIQAETKVAVETVEKSKEDVNEGMEFITQLRNDFQQMFGFLEDIHRQMTDLSALSEEMSAGAEEVSTAVDETMETTTGATEAIAHVTEKIASQHHMVDEMKRATEELEKTAQSLKHSIERFTIE